VHLFDEQPVAAQSDAVAVLRRKDVAQSAMAGILPYFKLIFGIV
jgi:hypothetical protein